ncbi:MAG: hypothetical protein HGA31_06315 [Candidatus Moranbacteria bacterium]|nr:hypothetical protein [Candidatus Moranbacteria bacterium]
MATSKKITIPEEIRHHSLLRRTLVEIFLLGRKRKKEQIVRWVLVYDSPDSNSGRVCTPSDVRFQFDVHVLMTKNETVEEGNRKLRDGDFEVEPYWFYYSLLRLKKRFGIALTPLEAEYVASCGGW